MVCKKWLLDLLDGFENDNKSIINIELLLEHHFFLTRQKSMFIFTKDEDIQYKIFRLQNLKLHRTIWLLYQ